MKCDYKIFVTGDIHGNPHQLKKKLFPIGKSLSKKDVVIILGDFGLLWSTLRTKEEDYWIKWLDDQPWTTLFIDGNHENFHLLNNLPEKELFGNKVGIVSHSIFHLNRGIVYNINNNKILTIGGAHSHDRQYRTWNKTMWKEEEISNENISNAISSSKVYDFNIDYVMTHCAPVEYAKMAIPLNMMDHYMPDPSEEQLSRFKAFSNVKFKHWFFGHYHNNINDPIHNLWSCLYDKVIQL